MAKAHIVGREEEIKIFDEVIKSKEAEFVAVYGRRRVGKTFLVREYFSKAGVYFETTGVKDATLPEQMEYFIKDFSEAFYRGVILKRPTGWNDAFDLLTNRIGEAPKNKKVIIFLDELPWMASRKSRLLQALDYYWNRYWSQQSNLVLIVCGSAASWMLSNLIHAKGGLHNRLTKRIIMIGVKLFLFFPGDTQNKENSRRSSW